MNYIENVIEENKILDLEFAFRREFQDKDLRLIVTKSSSALKFCVHDSNLKVVAIAEVTSYELKTKDLQTLGIKKDELSHEQISEAKLRRFWVKFLAKTYPESYKESYLFEAKWKHRNAMREMTEIYSQEISND